MKYPWKGLVRGILAVAASGGAMMCENASAQQGWEAKRLMRVASEARASETAKATQTADPDKIAGIAKFTETPETAETKNIVAVTQQLVPKWDSMDEDEAAVPVEVHIREMNAETPEDEADETTTAVMHRWPTLATSPAPAEAADVHQARPSPETVTKTEEHTVDRSTFCFPRPAFRLLPDVVIQPISLPKIEFRLVSLPGVGRKSSAECEKAYTETHTVAKPASNAFRIAVSDRIAGTAKSPSPARPTGVKVATTATDEMLEETTVYGDADCNCEHGKEHSVRNGGHHAKDGDCCEDCGLFGCVQNCHAPRGGLGFFGNLFRMKSVCVPVPNLPYPLMPCSCGETHAQDECR